MRNFLIPASVVLFSIPLFAHPHYLEALQSDSMLKPEFPTHCGTCHVNPNGGGPRNKFGELFESQKTEFTPLLRARDGVKFVYPKLKVTDNLTIHFSDPKNKQVVLEMEDRKFVVIDAEAQKVTP